MCILASLLTACTQMPKIAMDIPPVVLVPISNAGIEDGRGRFREIYCVIRDDHGAMLPDDRPCNDALYKLPDEPNGNHAVVNTGSVRQKIQILVVPGIFGECVAALATPFEDALPHLREHGYRTGIIPVSGRSGSSYNAREIKSYFDEHKGDPSEKIILIGYSKGATDILEALVAYPDVAARVSAVISVAGVVSGTPIADEMVDVYDRLLSNVSLRSCPPGDKMGVESLRRSTRLSWLARNQFPKTVRYYSIGAFAGPEDISALLLPLYLDLARTDPRNDSQVAFFDAVIPGGTLLGFVKADHWAIALPIARKFPQLGDTVVTRNHFPREVMLEAAVRFVDEQLEATK